MSGLLEPVPVDQIAADPRHPFYDRIINQVDLIITVDGKPVDDVLVADKKNGFVRCYARDKDHKIITKKLNTRRPGMEQLVTFTRKGVVGIYYAPEEDA